MHARFLLLNTSHINFAIGLNELTSLEKIYKDEMINIILWLCINSSRSCCYSSPLLAEPLFFSTKLTFSVPKLDVSKFSSRAFAPYICLSACLIWSRITQKSFEKPSFVCFCKNREKNAFAYGNRIEWATKALKASRKSRFIYNMRLLYELLGVHTGTTSR